MRTRDMAHNHELNLAYCVAVWQNKEEDDDLAVELFDHSFPSLAEKKWPPQFAERYRPGVGMTFKIFSNVMTFKKTWKSKVKVMTFDFSHAHPC